MAVSITIGNPYRGLGSVTPATFNVAGVSLSTSWGSQPGSAVIEYVPGSDPAMGTLGTTGILAGAAVTIGGIGRSFYGFCKSDVLQRGSSGVKRRVSCVDLREILQWDYVFGSFNRLDYRMTLVGGVLRRRRRYMHILPADFNAHHVTWTDTPYTAAQIVTMILGAPTVYAPWATTYHSDMSTVPVYELDFTQGTRLDQALTMVSDRLGLVFTFDGVASSHWQLRWARKGYGTFPLPLDGSGNIIWTGVTRIDNTEEGVAITERPTCIRVLGDRNVWQIMNVTLTPDWLSPWEAYWDEGKFIDAIYHNFTDETGTIYASRTDSGDPEHVIAHQMATERAYRITVTEWAAVMGSGYLDLRLFHNRSRAEMPAILYLRTLMYRAFRLPDTLNLGGSSVPAIDTVPTDRTLIEMSHDPATGVMSPVLDSGIPRQSEDRGYAVAQFFNLSQDFLSTLRPDQVDMSSFSASRNQWTKVDFSIQEGGDGRVVLVFELPMIRSANLVVSQDGWYVPNAAATITPCTVKVSIAVEAEPFRYDYGDRVTGTENGPLLVINEQGLHQEILWDATRSPSGTNPGYLTYADGKTALQKAVEVINAERIGAFQIRSGGYTRYLLPGDTGTSLDGLIDRVEISYSARGLTESVTFTNERGLLVWWPERDYERRALVRALFPGQAELRKSQEDFRRVVSALRGNRLALDEFYRHWRGLYKTDLSTLRIASGAGTLPAGTPLWKAPSDNSTGRLSNVQAVMPSAVSTAHTVLAGVTVRHNEAADRPLPVAVSGLMQIRVRGPVAVGDGVGQPASPAGKDYLEKVTTGAIGTARQAVADGVTALIEVTTGGGGGAARLVWA